MNEHPEIEDLLADPLSEAVAAHLEQCTDCRKLWRLAAPVSGAEPPPTLPPLGSTFLATAKRVRARIPDRFVVGQWLRSTGRSEVFRAFDKVRNRTVGVVVLTHARDVAHSAERLQRFAGIVANGVEQVQEVIVNDDAVLYTTAIVEGPALDRQALGGAFTYPEITRCIALALTTLHRRGLVHGNVQASSIRVQPTGSAVLVDPDPDLGDAAGPSDDWRRLGEVLLDQVDEQDRPLRELAEALARGGVDDLDVLTLLLALRPGDEARRYQRLGPIDSGGMGEVRRVRDPDLDRVVAQKVMHASRVTPVLVARFLAEARITAQLQHPGITPVHDVGRLTDGRPYFTMKEVRGRLLGEAIREVHAAHRAGTWQPGPTGWTLRRLVEALQKAAEAVAYAHARGVIHRDLKPGNIRLGEFGEVYVLDWGLAKDGSETTPVEAHDGGGSETVVTQDGTVLGTPGYQAPEQVRGEIDAHCPASDVFSLGAILFEILTGRPPPRVPVEGEASRAWTTPDPTDFAPPGHPELPPELVALCRRAMAVDPAERPDHAGHVVDALRSWLDGAERRAVALERLQGADEIARRMADSRRSAEERRRRAAALLKDVLPHAPVEDKIAAWDEETRAEQLEQQADALEIEYLQVVRGALEHCPELPEARRLLFDYYRDRLVEAEACGDERSVLRYERLLSSDPSRRHAAWVTGDGAVTLLTDPPGAEVRLHRYVEHHRRLQPVFERDLGRTPLHRVSVPRGSSVLEIRAPGRAVVWYPVFLRRGEHWDGVGPTGDPVPIVLPAEGALAPGDCYVPAGWFLAGGDSEAPDALPRRRLWVPALVVRQHPVTHQEYVRFLNDLLAQGRVEEAERHAPTEAAGYGDARRPVYQRDTESRFVAAGTMVEHARWGPDWPVVLVDHEGARAYAAWYSAQTGVAWDLPHDLEWEKAARGVDGRAFPWGNRLDPTFACMATSHTGAPTRTSVHAHPADRSPYGVQGLAGNVRDWCRNDYLRHGLSEDVLEVPAEEPPPPRRKHRVARGGSWTSVESWCRAAARFGPQPQDRNTSVGFRLCRRL